MSGEGRSGHHPWSSVALSAALFTGLVAGVIAGLGVEWLVTGEPPFDSDPTIQIEGGCDPFRVHAQNRWSPFGAAVREAPNIESTQLYAVQGNDVIFVDGWVHSRAPYPTNTAPWNSDVWFHVVDGGWVSFAGVRENPTAPDPEDGFGEGGDPAVLIPECQAVLAG